MSSLLRGRNGAGVEAAPDAIAPVGDDTIAQIAHRPGNPAEHFADRRPRTWQNGEQRDGRIGTDEDLLRSAAGIAHDENRGGTEGTIEPTCRASNSATLGESDGAKRMRSPRSRRRNQRTERLQKPQRPSKMTSSRPSSSSRLFTTRGILAPLVAIQFGGCPSAMPSILNPR